MDIDITLLTIYIYGDNPLDQGDVQMTKKGGDCSEAAATLKMTSRRSMGRLRAQNRICQQDMDTKNIK
jgi:hypothetical protein